MNIKDLYRVEDSEDINKVSDSVNAPGYSKGVDIEKVKEVKPLLNKDATTLIVVKSQRLLNLWGNELEGQASDGLLEERGKAADWLWKDTSYQLGDVNQIYCDHPGSANFYTIFSLEEIPDVLERIKEKCGFLDKKEVHSALNIFRNMSTKRFVKPFTEEVLQKYGFSKVSDSDESILSKLIVGETYNFIEGAKSFDAKILLKNERSLVVCLYPESIDQDALKDISFKSYQDGSFLEAFPDDEREEADDAVCKWFLQDGKLKTVYSKELRLKKII